MTYTAYDPETLEQWCSDKTNFQLFDSALHDYLQIFTDTGPWIVGFSMHSGQAVTQPTGTATPIPVPLYPISSLWIRTSNVCPPYWILQMACCLWMSAVSNRNYVEPGSEIWLYLRKYQDGRIKYFVSNAPGKIEPQELDRAATLRWPIEQCFEEYKSYLGMGHYECRLLQETITFTCSHMLEKVC